MTEVEIAQDALIVHLEGIDRLFALRSRLEVPLSHVAGVEVDPEEARRRLVIEVEDPEATVAQVNEAARVSEST